MMKKLLGILVLGLLWCNAGFAEEQKKAIDTSGLEGVIKLEPYSGQKLIDSDGSPFYYSIKQKQYISCKEFNREGGQILDPERKEEIFVSTPACHGDEHKSEGRTYVYDATNEKWIPKPTLSERFKENSQSILFVSIVLILLFFLIKFKTKIEKSIPSKIKFIKQNKVRVFATLSIVYLCFMLWLNWLGHQSPWVIYTMTYTWFLSWGVFPVVVGWSLYLVWRKK